MTDGTLRSIAILHIHKHVDLDEVILPFACKPPVFIIVLPHVLL